ncbi:hypothetical protein [Pimelobacter simplex]|uniref:hypothetical protein n=1 Tax=Nocardioides simplex TaxID=2045 RepID=UPI00214FF9F4|nr:hypothetical protein [Pimelobacter simplex]UUW88393.1 hypothetical protein M0M43_21975 [Pimelobacter simplex]UUW97897.1 hypothetical protein M0M48_10620 [Pimelobacter simplex]
MSHTPLPTHPTRKHPRTGLALEAVGFRRSGAPIWPILGASPTDPPAPVRPEGVTEEEWAALGDPGRAAIVREREARQTAERELAAARARPAPPKPADPPKATPPKPADPPNPYAGPDIAAIVQQAVEAAVKPFAERDAQRDAESAAQKVTDAVLEATKDRLHDATDALTNVDLTTLVNEQGGVDTDKLKTALDDLVTRKPHLAKPEAQRIAPPGIGGGGGSAGVSEGDKVKAVLAEMHKATGVRPLSTPS